VDPSSMRIGDKERQQVAEVLRDAAGDGRIDMEELDERLGLTWNAKTYADLVPITADLHLPAAAPHAAPAPRPAVGAPVGPGHAGSVAIMSECKRQGAWHLPAHHAAFALMGSVTLDLRLASLESNDVSISANAIMGEVKIIIPAHMQAIVDGMPIMGEFGQGKDKVVAEIGPHSPVVRVKGMALMGSVTVVRLPPPGTPKKIIGTY